eukprot:m.170084 g.170084  ORF g.170084 m.170084 type:complete len:384 (+) comp39029_c2_seq8:1148-2299(+)
MSKAYILCFFIAFFLPHRSNGVSLELLCKTTFGRRRLGAKCDPYLPVCEVSPWSEWAQAPVNSTIDDNCPGKAKGVEERFRSVTKEGEKCPSLRETRETATCLSAITTAAVNAMKIYKALGGGITPGKGNSPPSAIVNDITTEIKKLLGAKRRKRMTSVDDCTCPCVKNSLEPSRDIVVVMDSSGSIGKANFIEAVASLMQLLTRQCHFSECIAKDYSRLAVVVFSSGVEVIVDFNAFERDYKDTNKLIDLFNSLPYVGGGTSTGKALEKVRDEILVDAAGMRVNSKKTIILLTDGKSYGVKPGPVAKSISDKFQGLNILALAIGSNVNRLELDEITHHNNEDGNALLLFSGFDDFNGAVESIIQYAGTCQLLRPDEIFDKRR